MQSKILGAGSLHGNALNTSGKSYLNELKHVGMQEGAWVLKEMYKYPENIIGFELLGSIYICKRENCCSPPDHVRLKELLFQRSFLIV